MKSLHPVICSDDVRAARDFYVSLLGLRVVFEIDWFVQLQSAVDPNVQIGFVQRNHPSVPERSRERPRGVFVTVEVEDVDTVHERARVSGSRSRTRSVTSLGASVTS